ncbi:MAG: methyltransferase [Candidatus Micrarchaeota archaeon]|nr:methyltransferase [Candidatus Micrarchaeota archaeon]
MDLFASVRGFFAPEIETFSETKDGIRYSISEKGDMRYFKFNGIVYSQLSKSSVLVYSYHDKFLLLPALYEKPRILLIGLGAGTIPYQLSKLYPGMFSLDVVDTNPESINHTKKFLQTNELPFNVIIESGEKYVEKCTNQYDIIIQDAFVNDRIPAQFTDDKFIASAKKALSPDGILAINYAPEVVYLPFYKYKLRKQFQHVYHISHISMGNYILLSSKQFDKKEMLDKIEARTWSESNAKILLKSYKSMK